MYKIKQSIYMHIRDWLQQRFDQAQLRYSPIGFSAIIEFRYYCILSIHLKLVDSKLEFNIWHRQGHLPGIKQYVAMTQTHEGVIDLVHPDSIDQLHQLLLDLICSCILENVSYATGPGDGVTPCP